MIEVRVKRNGRIEVKVDGVKGASCEDVSEFLTKLGTIEQSKKTEEYYEEETEIHTQVTNG